jgi:hypothetical protein
MRSTRGSGMPLKRNQPMGTDSHRPGARDADTPTEAPPISARSLARLSSSRLMGFVDVNSR